MNLNMEFKRAVTFLSIVAVVTTLISCQPDKLGEGNGLISTKDLDATFTITPVEGKNNTYIFSATNENYLTSHWNVADGSGFNVGRVTKEVFFPDAGTYNIQHKVADIGGVSEVASLSLKVETSDPIAGNIIKGGRFDAPEDISQWSIVNISASGTEWTFADGKATVQGGNWNQKGIYQTIEVIEGLTYKIDMLVSSTSGVQDTWFEVFAAPTVPVDGSDYVTGLIAKFSTWGADGECDGFKETFSGKLSEIGCDFTGEQGKFVAETTETIYLVIKCGGGNLMDGVSIDNIEMRVVK